MFSHGLRRTAAASGAALLPLAFVAQKARCEGKPGQPAYTTGLDFLAKRGELPTYTADRSFPWDESTYENRVKNCFLLTDPTTLLIPQWYVQLSKETIDAAAQPGWRRPEQLSDLELWRRAQIVATSYHPATGEETWWPGRMAAFVLVNTPVAVGMVFHGPTSTAATLFWQVANQSVNAVCNYVNRAGSEVSVPQLAQSYGLAVGTSCAVAGFFSSLVRAVPTLALLGPLVPYLGVVAASTANMMSSRMVELQEGITVTHPETREPLGKSQTAAQQAVLLTLMSRSWLVPVPVILLPPLLARLGRFAVPALFRSSAMAKVMDVGFVILSIAGALPFALAWQPRDLVLPVSTLEAEFQDKGAAGGFDTVGVYRGV